MFDFIYRLIAENMPKKLVYYATIRLMAHGTSGKYEHTNVPSVRAMTVLKRWEKDKGIF